MNTTLVASRVEPYSPGDECASVTLRSNLGEITAFCWGRDLKEGDTIKNRLSALDAEARAAYLQDWPEEEKEEKSKERLEQIGPHAYRGVGRVIDPNSGLIEVLGFKIELGDVPCDEAVEFECMRVDV